MSLRAGREAGMKLGERLARKIEEVCGLQPTGHFAGNAFEWDTKAVDITTLSSALAAAALAHVRDALTRDVLAKALWEAHPTPNDRSVVWENLIPGEFGHFWSYKQADAILALLDAAGT